MTEESTTNEKEIGPEAEEKEDIESLKKALTEEKARAETNLAGWQRVAADFINYKRRSELEKAETIKYANTELMLSLLPILDDLGRAFETLPPEMAEVGWVKGMKLLDCKLRATLAANGLSPIKALGEPFDPRVHEAVMQAAGKDGIVISELQKGYKLNDRVIRPSKVVVGSGEEEKEETQPENTPV